MRRLLLCLPLCLLMAPASSGRRAPARAPDAPAAKVADDGRTLPDHAGMERLAREAPVAFLENCLRRYQREVKKGYTLTFHKQERLDGKLQRSELIEVAFREEPYGVLFRWREGARLAERALYVEGANDGKLLVKLSGVGSLLGAVARDVDGADAKRSGRYTLKEFGLKKAALRTLTSWKAAKDNNALHVEYLGVRKIKEAGDRDCYVLRRSRYQKPENDGVLETTLYVDKETWLQVGSVLKGEDGKLIGEYFFRDVKLDPEFKPGQFERKALE